MLANPTNLWFINTDRDATGRYGYGTKMSPHNRRVTNSLHLPQRRDHAGGPAPAISPFDIGLLRGYAVFDLLRTVGGKPFMLAEHLKRLHGSAEHLNLVVPATDPEIAEAIGELLRLNGHDEATVRLVLTGGPSPDGMGYDPNTPTFLHPHPRPA